MPRSLITHGKAATPIGVPCCQCERPIEEGDRGFIRPLVTEKGLAKDVAIHRGCNMATTIGHLLGLCTCTGWDDVNERGQELVRRSEVGELKRIEPRATT